MKADAAGDNGFDVDEFIALVASGQSGVFPRGLPNVIEERIG